MQEEDDFALRRFLRARDHNIGKVSAMLLQYLSWKRVAKPHGSISGEEVLGATRTRRTRAGAGMAGASVRRWRDDDDRRRIPGRGRGDGDGGGAPARQGMGRRGLVLENEREWGIGRGSWGQPRSRSDRKGRGEAWGVGVTGWMG